MLPFEVKLAHSHLNLKNLIRIFPWDLENLYYFLQVNRQHLTVFYDLLTSDIDIINITGFDGINEMR